VRSRNTFIVLTVTLFARRVLVVNVEFTVRVLNVPLVVTNVLIAPYFARIVLVVSVEFVVRVLKVAVVVMRVLITP